MQGLTIRAMREAETSMVLSNWKKELFEHRGERGWSRNIEERDYWCLVNYVLDRITLPSCLVFVGHHLIDEETPMCWVAARRIKGLQTYEVVYLYARKSVRGDPELAASLERALLYEVSRICPLADERRPYNPFLELRR